MAAYRNRIPSEHKNAQRSSKLKKALGVAKRYPIFPVRVSPDPAHPGKTKKVPRVKWTEKATQNTATITRWWKKWPDAHIGVPTGEASGIFVVDIDKDGTKNGFKWLKSNPLPATRTHKTRRGKHFLFQHSKGVGSNSDEIAPGVDLRGDGGFIVWWPGEGLQVSNKGIIAKAPKGLLAEIQKPESSEAGERGDLDVLTNHKLRDVKKKLRRVDPDKVYSKWYQIGAAIKLQFGDSGFDAWNDWSAVGEKYPGEEALRSKWKSFKRTDGNVVTLRSLERWTNPNKKPKKPASDAPIVFRHAADLVKERRMPEWLIRHVLEKNVIALLSGERGTYKSFIALEWAMRSAVAGQGVVILSGEGAGLGRRIHAWMKTHGKGLKLRDLPIMTFERILDLSSDRIVDQLAKAVEGCGFDVDLIVVDTLSKYSGGIEESSNAEASDFLSRLARKIREVFAATILLVAHSGHTQVGRTRGASAWIANTDAEYNVSLVGDSSVQITRQRFKDTPSQEDLAYLVDHVDLGYVDEELESVTSLVLTEMPPVPHERKRAKLGGIQAIILQVVQESTDEEGWADEAEVVKKSCERLPKNDGARDRRLDRVRSCIEGLSGNMRIELRAGKIREKS